jgi:ribonuclease HII
MKSAKYLVGVDEAGRGPLAGPVAVGMVKIPHDFNWSLIPGVTDFAVSQVGASVIDTRGISHAIRLATNRCIARLQLNPRQVTIRLDGSLAAPTHFKQATIIKGDALYPEIGLASIVAKETRDAYMTRIARRFSRYGFEQHKGYGTKDHRHAIKTFGLSPIHRATYCKNCL